MEKFYSKRRAISGRLNDIRKRIAALKHVDKKRLRAERATIRYELMSILENHKKDAEFKEKERHLYSKILKNIAANLFLLEEIK